MICHSRFSNPQSALVIFAYLGLIAIFIGPPARSMPDDKSKDEHLTRAEVERLMAQWEKDAKDKMSKDPDLKKTSQKYPFVLLRSRQFGKALFGGQYAHCAFSFARETADDAIHQNSVQIIFDNGPGRNWFSLNSNTGCQNLLADLGKVDFTKDPDVKKIDLDGDGLNSWDPKNCQAAEGHVYVEKVRDEEGNNFYAMFQIVTLDKDGRFVAFIWRRLPGGKVVKG